MSTRDRTSVRSYHITSARSIAATRGFPFARSVRGFARSVRDGLTEAGALPSTAYLRRTGIFHCHHEVPRTSTSQALSWGRAKPDQRTSIGLKRVPAATYPPTEWSKDSPTLQQDVPLANVDGMSYPAYRQPIAMHRTRSAPISSERAVDPRSIRHGPYGRPGRALRFALCRGSAPPRKDRLRLGPSSWRRRRRSPRRSID